MNRWLCGALLAAAACAAQAFTQAEVQLGKPSIRVQDLQPHDGVTARYVEGGAVYDAFVDLLAPAPVSAFIDGAARILKDAPDSVGGRTDGPAARFLIVGDRYAPSFTFTVSAGSRVTVTTPYRLTATVAGEGFDAGAPPQAFASLELALVALTPLDAGSFALLATPTASDLLASPADRAFDGRLQRSGVLSVTFDNLGASDAVFAFRGEMAAFGASGTCFNGSSARRALRGLFG